MQNNHFILDPSQPTTLNPAPHPLLTLGIWTCTTLPPTLQPLGPVGCNAKSTFAGLVWGARAHFLWLGGGEGRGARNNTN